MTFVIADSCRIQMESLTQLFFSEFPGSTVYQHTRLFRVPYDVLHNKVDAVFLEAEPEKADSLDFMRRLRREKPNLPVFILSKTGDFREKSEKAGANGCFVLPDDERQLLDAIRLVKNREKGS